MEKNKIIKIIVFLAIIIIAIIGINVYAETAEEKIIKNEESLVRMTAQLSRGAATSNKVEISTLSSELNKYAGNGATTVSEKSSDTLLVTFASTGNEYEININSGTLVNIPELPGTEYTAPYLPSGFTPVTGTDLSNGLTIQDPRGNQYVWVEVPRSNEVYPTAGVNITAFEDGDYIKIENDLRTYTSTYRKEPQSISFKDEFYSTELNGFADADEYNAYKYKMLKSVYQNGGFYVGKYETGIADSEPDVIDATVEARTSSSQDIANYMPVIQANAYPYNYVTNKQAQELASTKFSGGGYTTSLMFGVQWDLVLKYMETKAVEQGVALSTIQSELSIDSKRWGNYTESTYNITEESAKNYVSSWVDGTYEKTSSGNVLLSTGANEAFCKQGIYDFAGNLYEYTLESAFGNEEFLPCIIRGVGTNISDNLNGAAGRYSSPVSFSYLQIGFRVSLF